jgi:hypothetical protein
MIRNAEIEKIISKAGMPGSLEAIKLKGLKII